MGKKPGKAIYSGGDTRGAIGDFAWLVSLIRNLRPDLCKLFKTSNEVSLELATWLITSGKSEYRILAENGNFRNIFTKPLKVLGITPVEALIYLERPDVQKSFPLPREKENFRQWFFMHGVDEHKVLDFLDEAGKEQYYALHPEKLPENSAALQAEPERPFGVNLIGYAYGQLGIGEDLRMTARALQSVGVPFTIINFPPGADIPQNDMSVAEFVGQDAPYKFNLFCMTAIETGRFYAENGSEIFRGRYNIGYWPWELAQWPEEWRAMTALVDEVWVSSRHIYDALAPISPVPVLIMPLAVEIGPVSNLGRQDFHLPEETYLFCFSFDLNSSIHRKNPRACLKAFQKAFPIGEPTEKPVGLVIKCHKPKKANEYWDKLKEAAKREERIFIIEETLSRPDLLALYKNCDCYLSLHRAEGFGRGMAEALLLGLDVIATGYSGNVDYCQGNPAAHLAEYKPVPVKNGEYPYGEGQVWAEADPEHTARLMRQCALQKAKARGNIEDIVGIRNAGKRYRERLKFVWQNQIGSSDY